MFVSVRELKHTPALEIPINSATVRIRKVNILVADVEESLCRPSVDRSGRISDERVVPDVHVLLLSTVYEDVMNPYVRRIEPLGEIREIVDVQMDHVGKFPRCHFHEFTQRIPYCRPAAYLLEALPGNAVEGGILALSKGIVGILGSRLELFLNLLGLSTIFNAPVGQIHTHLWQSTHCWLSEIIISRSASYLCTSFEHCLAHA